VEEPSYDKVLVAIDGSAGSRRVLEHARLLAAIHGSEVIVFHARQKAYSGAAVFEVGSPPEVSAEDAAAELVAAGIKARALEEDAFWKQTADAIVEAAKRESTGLIVIGSRGLGRVPASILGSVAYKVLHLSDQPVLVVP
jgi:nucleotide-binding universal stress UspA family protein